MRRPSSGYADPFRYRRAASGAPNSRHEVNCASGGAMAATSVSSTNTKSGKIAVTSNAGLPRSHSVRTQGSALNTLRRDSFARLRHA
jgi:hypothetical protein